MKLAEIIRLVKNCASANANIGTVIDSDIYKLNHMQDVAYPAFA